MSKIIYNEQGNFEDVSDEGKFESWLYAGYDLRLAIKQANLTKREQEAIDLMLNKGLGQREAAREYKISRTTIKRAFSKIREVILKGNVSQLTE
jgi:predicted DNA-binding protein (UPF0251 family)